MLAGSLETRSGPRLIPGGSLGLVTSLGGPPEILMPGGRLGGAGESSLASGARTVSPVGRLAVPLSGPKLIPGGSLGLSTLEGPPEILMPGGRLGGAGESSLSTGLEGVSVMPPRDASFSCSGCGSVMAGALTRPTTRPAGRPRGKLGASGTVVIWTETPGGRLGL